MADVDFDPTPYLSTPRTSARDYIALGRLLLRYKPGQVTAQVERAAERLAAEIETFTTGLAARHSSHTGAATIDEAELDFATDGLWYSLRDRLDNWAVFERKAFTLLAEDPRADGFDYRACIEKAKRARSLRRRLLGGIGTDFTRKPYAEQVEFMDMIWHAIEQEGLAEELSDLIGDDFLEALRDCQKRYVDMVAAQSAAGHEPGVNLNDVRVQLWRALVHYNATLIAMLDDRDPSSVELVRGALLPVEMLREYNVRKAGGIALEGEEGIDIDPLLAEQAAVNRALGIDERAGDEALSELSG